MSSWTGPGPGWRSWRRPRGTRPAARCTRRPGPTGWPTWSTRTRCSRSASPTRGCWPPSPTCSATSSCPRSTAAPQPGAGLQALHAEGGPTGLGPYQVCNSIWLLDDFTEENGATRVVPGSHRRTVRVGDELPDPLAPHPEQVTLTAPAGTVIVFNSHLWHGG